MSIAAIICEYNPFHNGHKFQIEQAKKLLNCNSVICVMSGNFIQRGDIALYDKLLRAKAAILGGADLVLELPTVYAMQSAEIFARNAVTIINSLGIADYLVFGAETDNINSFNEIAEILIEEPDSFKSSLSEYISRGISFPKAREMALSVSSDILKQPNNILALEYIKALKLLKSNTKPFIIKRSSVQHNSDFPCDNFASASFIRKSVLGNSFDIKHLVPTSAYELYKSASPKNIMSMSKSIIANIYKMNKNELKNICDVSEGLENRIKREALDTDNIFELAEKIKSKRYTLSRIRRILLASYLGITKNDQELTPQYIKILDFNENGQQILNKIKKVTSLPLFKNTSQMKKLTSPIASEIWNRELEFDRIYNLF